MGFTTTTFASAEPEVFLAQPLMERVKTLALNWVDNGFGVPRMVHVIYLVKLAVFYVHRRHCDRDRHLRSAGLLARQRSGGINRSSTRR